MMESSPPPPSSSLAPRVLTLTKKEIEEYVLTLLDRKVRNLPLPDNTIGEMDVYDPQTWSQASGDNFGIEYCFVRREKKSSSKSAKRNANRRLKSKGNSSPGGWWHGYTGDKPIEGDGGEIIGYKNTLTLFFCKNQKCDRNEAYKTGWIMHEYKLPHPTFQEWVVCGIRCKRPTVRDTRYKRPKVRCTRYKRPEGTRQEHESQSVGHRDMIQQSKEQQSQWSDQHLQQEGRSMLEDQQAQAHQDSAYDQTCKASPPLNIGSDGQRGWASACDFGLSELASALGCHWALELGNQAQDSNRALPLNGWNEQEMTNSNELLGPDFWGLMDPSCNGFQDTQVQLPQPESFRESEQQDRTVYDNHSWPYYPQWFDIIFQSLCFDQHLQQEGRSMLEDQQAQAHQDSAYDPIYNASPLLNIGSDGQRSWPSACGIGSSEPASTLGCHWTSELGNQAQDSNRALPVNGWNEQEVTNSNGLSGPDLYGLNGPGRNGFLDAQVQLLQAESFRESEQQDGTVYDNHSRPCYPPLFDIDVVSIFQSQCSDQHLQREGRSMLEDQQAQAYQDSAYDQTCNAYPPLNIGSDGQRSWASACDFGSSEQASGLGCHWALELGNQAQDSNRALPLNGCNEQEMTNNNVLLGPDFCGLNDPSLNGFLSPTQFLNGRSTRWDCL